MQQKIANGEGKAPTMQDVAEFLAATPNPDDDQFHAWAESKGYDTHQAEAVAYQLATVASKFVTGGKTGEKTVTTEDVSGKQMQEGRKVEKEHTPDVGSAKKIAMDHLDEIPDYYTRLKKMEDQAKGQQKQGAEDNFDWAMREAQKTHQAYAKGKRPPALSIPPAANVQERESDKRWDRLVSQGQDIHRQNRGRTKPVRIPTRVQPSTDPQERASDKRWDRLISESQALRKGRRA